MNAYSDLARQQRQSDMAEIGGHYISLTLLVLAANYVRHVAIFFFKRTRLGRIEGREVPQHHFDITGAVRVVGVLGSH